MGVGCKKKQHAALWLNATRYNSEASALLDVCLACNGAILQFTEPASALASILNFIIIIIVRCDVHINNVSIAFVMISACETLLLFTITVRVKSAHTVRKKESK